MSFTGAEMGTTDYCSQNWRRLLMQGGLAEMARPPLCAWTS